MLSRDTAYPTKSFTRTCGNLQGKPCLTFLYVSLILLRALHFFEDDTHATAEFILEVEKYVNEKIFGNQFTSLLIDIEKT